MRRGEAQYYSPLVGDATATGEVPVEVSGADEEDGRKETARTAAMLTLSGVDLEVPAGCLTCIYGPTGCGKSSLLSALLGDVECLAGSARVGGSVSYCPQKAWVQNASLRENIIFGYRRGSSSMEANDVSGDDDDDERDVGVGGVAELDADAQARYEKVIRVCCLEEDLKGLPAGDATEIGERGVNLRRQQQRVPRAGGVRALRRGAPRRRGIVGRGRARRPAPFHDCILDFLLREEKRTVVLVSHSVSHHASRGPRGDYGSESRRKERPRR